jgi:hypothetical protein
VWLKVMPLTGLSREWHDVILRLKDMISLMRRDNAVKKHEHGRLCQSP